MLCLVLWKVKRINNLFFSGLNLFHELIQSFLIFFAQIITFEKESASCLYFIFLNKFVVFCLFRLIFRIAITVLELFFLFQLCEFIMALFHFHKSL